jgi:hypothetical protein
MIVLNAVFKVQGFVMTMDVSQDILPFPPATYVLNALTDAPHAVAKISPCVSVVLMEPTYQVVPAYPA